MNNASIKGGHYLHGSFWSAMTLVAIAVAWSSCSRSIVDRPNVQAILKEALQVIDMTVPAIKVEIIPDIALVQAKGGDRSAADETLQNLTGLIEKVGLNEHTPAFEDDGLGGEEVMSWPVMALLKVALVQGQINDIPGQARTIMEANRVAESEPNSFSKAYDLQNVAIAQLQSGDSAGAGITVQKALQVCNSVYNSIPKKAGTQINITPKAFKHHIAMRIADTQLKLGDRTSAESAVQNTLLELERRDYWATSRTLWEIATVQARMGDAQGALATIQGKTIGLDQREWKKPSTAASVLMAEGWNIFDAVNAASLLNEAGQKTEAASMIQQFIETALPSKQQDLSDAWEKIAIARLQAGDIAGALDARTRATGSLFTEMFDHLFYAQLATIQAKSGDVDGALKSIERIHKGNGDVRDSLIRAGFEAPALRTVGSALVTNGDYPKALAWAHNWPWPDQKSYALLGVAEGLLSLRKSSKN